MNFHTQFKTTHEQSTKAEMYFDRKTLHSQITRNTKKTYQDWVLTNDPTFKAPKT